ncbi:MAG: iron-containing alcohol dehydrogenase [Lachnospiraceae bacterium]|nr:iron-containing alcohol dehydrogenase [Lachnospiraceae bacterium]
MESFILKTKLSFGEGALERLSQIPYKKVLIVTDSFIASSDMIHLITDPLKRANIEYRIFDDVKPDPPIRNIAAGLQAFLEFDPEAMIMVGGGSSIDSGKGIKQLMMVIKPDRDVPMIAIPTTSGTGSEVTSFAVISNPDENTKFAIKSDDLIPTEAILDAKLVESVPPNVTADTGMDVFTHALEAYVSTNANSFTDALAEKSASLVSQFLIRSFHSKDDTHAREKMHNASCLAGLAFNIASLGLNHAMAHQLGAVFHIPHGRANAMLLTRVITFNTGIDQYANSRQEHNRSCIKKYVDMSKCLGLSLATEAMAIRALNFFIEYMLRELHIPKSISEYGKIPVGDYFQNIDRMAEMALKDSTLATNPTPVTFDDIKKIYIDLW